MSASSSSDDDSYSSSSHGGYDSDESSIGTILPAQLRDAPPEEVYSDEEERVARVEAVVGQAERQRAKAVSHVREQHRVLYDDDEELMRASKQKRRNVGRSLPLFVDADAVPPDTPAPDDVAAAAVAAAADVGVQEYAREEAFGLLGGWSEGPLSPGIIGISKQGDVLAWDERRDGPFVADYAPLLNNIWVHPSPPKHKPKPSTSTPVSSTTPLATASPVSKARDQRRAPAPVSRGTSIRRSGTHIRSRAAAAASASSAAAASAAASAPPSRSRLHDLPDIAEVSTPQARTTITSATDNCRTKTATPPPTATAAAAKEAAAIAAAAAAAAAAVMPYTQTQTQTQAAGHVVGTVRSVSNASPPLSDGSGTGRQHRKPLVPSPVRFMGTAPASPPLADTQPRPQSRSPLPPEGHAHIQYQGRTSPPPMNLAQQQQHLRRLQAVRAQQLARHQHHQAEQQPQLIAVNVRTMDAEGLPALAHASSGNNDTRQQQDHSSNTSNHTGRPGSPIDTRVTPATHLFAHMAGDATYAVPSPFAKSTVKVDPGRRRRSSANSDYQDPPKRRSVHRIDSLPALSAAAGTEASNAASGEGSGAPVGTGTINALIRDHRERATERWQRDVNRERRSRNPARRRRSRPLGSSASAEDATGAMEQHHSGGGGGGADTTGVTLREWLDQRQRDRDTLSQRRNTEAARAASSAAAATLDRACGHAIANGDRDYARKALAKQVKIGRTVPRQFNFADVGPQAMAPAPAAQGDGGGAAVYASHENGAVYLRRRISLQASQSASVLPAVNKRNGERVLAVSRSTAQVAQRPALRRGPSSDSVDALEGGATGSDLQAGELATTRVRPKAKADRRRYARKGGGGGGGAGSGGGGGGGGSRVPGRASGPSKRHGRSKRGGAAVAKPVSMTQFVFAGMDNAPPPIVSEQSVAEGFAAHPLGKPKPAAPGPSARHAHLLGFVQNSGPGGDGVGDQGSPSTTTFKRRRRRGDEPSPEGAAFGPSAVATGRRQRPPAKRLNRRRSSRRSAEFDEGDPLGGSVATALTLARQAAM